MPKQWKGEGVCSKVPVSLCFQPIHPAFLGPPQHITWISCVISHPFHSGWLHVFLLYPEAEILSCLSMAQDWPRGGPIIYMLESYV